MAPSSPGVARSPAAGICPPRPKTRGATATPASGRPSKKGAVNDERHRAPARRSAAGRRGRAIAAAALVAAGGAHIAGGGASLLDARRAELLVRRGVHAGARAASEPVGDAQSD